MIVSTIIYYELLLIGSRYGVEEFMTVRTRNSLFALGSSNPRPQASHLGKC